MMYIKRARRPLGARQRPFFGELPEDRLPWPRVRPRPTPPATPNVWMYLPMLLLPLLTGVGSVLLQPNPSLRTVLPFLISGLGMGILYPTFQHLGYRRQLRAYENELKNRYMEFKRDIENIDKVANELASKQIRTLNSRYPKASVIYNIALNPKNWRKRIWIRERFDEDFLVLRVGVGTGKPSFTFEDIPSFPSGEDKELQKIIEQTYNKWQRINGVPIVVSLQKARNILIRGSRNEVRFVAHRLFLDLMVHHSPRLVRLGLIAEDSRPVKAAWNWIKWVPHTYALESPGECLLAFDSDSAYSLVDLLKKRTEGCIDKPDREDDNKYNDVIVMFFDDTFLRTHPDVTFIVNHGHIAGIYTIFVGDETTPKYPPRTEIVVTREGKFVLKKQVIVEREEGRKTRIIRKEGCAEKVIIEDLEKVARTLAGIEPPEPMHRDGNLPKLVSLADLFTRVCDRFVEESVASDQDPVVNVVVEHSDLRRNPEVMFTEKFVREVWGIFSQQLQQYDNPASYAILRHIMNFPIGLTIRGNKLEPIFLNLLPEGSKWGGHAAYHTILIGPTGSGKSEFIKALIWTGSFLYPPTLLNIFFIDFKGGAALEDLKCRYRDDGRSQEVEVLLPHIVGLVTNPGLAGDQELLGEAVARRGIYCLRKEFDRRMEIITKKGKAKDIWEYNHKFPENPLPHLLIILDEFSRALQDFPELAQVLDNLVRLGRSLGMYLLLANQDVTQQVTQLLANVGWRIALRMSGHDLRIVLGKSLPDITHVGRGYLMCVPTGEVAMFQSPYGGVSLYAEDDEFTIYDITDAGVREIVANLKPNRADVAEIGKSKLTQGRALSKAICKVTLDYQEFLPPRRVYLEPLPAYISLMDILQEHKELLVFRDGQWRTMEKRASSWKVPIGRMDDLENVQHQVLYFALDEEDGHFWIMGVPTSGRDKVVESLIAALAHLYTPEELYIYILDFGSGLLRHLTELPHIGSCIDISQEEERYRFFRFVHAEYFKRKGGDHVVIPRIIFVLYDFDFRSAIDMLSEEEYRLIHTLSKEGGKLGIHLIFVTSTPSSLRDELAGNLSRRYILELPRQEDYWNAGLPRQNLLPLTRRVLGRGYWATGRGENVQVHESQVAQVPWEQFLQAMNRTWDGERPPRFRSLPSCLPWSSWLEHVQKSGKEYHKRPTIFPIGLDFENLKPILIDLREETSVWLITGSSKKGKTSFLLLWAHEALEKGGLDIHGAQPWEVWYMSTTPLPEYASYLDTYTHFRAFIGEKSCLTALEQMHSHLTALEYGTRLMILIDEGDSILHLFSKLYELHGAIKDKRVYIVVSAKKASRTLMKLEFGTFGRLILQQCQDERIGLALDDDALSEFFNVSRRDIKPIWLSAWKQAKSGRAFFVCRDRLHLVQIPSINPC